MARRGVGGEDRPPAAYPCSRCKRVDRMRVRAADRSWLCLTCWTEEALAGRLPTLPGDDAAGPAPASGPSR